jgi:hypothetical protein
VSRISLNTSIRLRTITGGYTPSQRQTSPGRLIFVPPLRNGRYEKHANAKTHARGAVNREQVIQWLKYNESHERLRVLIAANAIVTSTHSIPCCATKTARQLYTLIVFRTPLSSVSSLTMKVHATLFALLSSAIYAKCPLLNAYVSAPTEDSYVGVENATHNTSPPLAQLTTPPSICPQNGYRAHLHPPTIRVPPPP